MHYTPLKLTYSWKVTGPQKDIPLPTINLQGRNCYFQRVYIPSIISSNPSPIFFQGINSCRLWFSMGKSDAPGEGRKPCWDGEGFQIFRDDFWSSLEGGKRPGLKGKFYVHVCCRGMKSVSDWKVEQQQQKWSEEKTWKWNITTNKPVFFFLGGGEMFKNTPANMWDFGNIVAKVFGFHSPSWIKFGNQESSEKTTNKNWVVVSKIFYFHPYLGKISNLTNIFEMVWSHQPQTDQDFQGFAWDSPHGWFFWVNFNTGFSFRGCEIMGFRRPRGISCMNWIINWLSNE